MDYLFLHYSWTKNISLSPTYRGSTRSLQGLYKGSTMNISDIGIYFLYSYNVTISIPQYLENLYTIPLYKFSRYCGILIVTLWPYKKYIPISHLSGLYKRAL